MKRYLLAAVLSAAGLAQADDTLPRKQQLEVEVRILGTRLVKHEATIRHCKSNPASKGCAPVLEEVAQITARVAVIVREYCPMVPGRTAIQCDSQAGGWEVDAANYAEAAKLARAAEKKAKAKK